MSFSIHLQRIVSKLDQTFLPDELAYLAATSKVEGPIRDRIAYGLYTLLDPVEVFVHREQRDPQKSGWIDIAVTDRNNYPLQLIELKAHSGTTFERGYSEKIRMDLAKLYKASQEDTESYLIFLFNHLYFPELLPSSFRYVIKYFDLQNFAARTNLFATDVRHKTKEHWEKHLKQIQAPIEKTHPGIHVPGGVFHGMPLEIHAYVLGPMLKDELQGQSR